MIRRPPISPLFPYTPLSRSAARAGRIADLARRQHGLSNRLAGGEVGMGRAGLDGDRHARARQVDPTARIDMAARDRKSTRLNSSHQIISYAVFCLKKKKSKQ